MAEGAVFKEKPKEAEVELPKIVKKPVYYHPVETFSSMLGNVRKKSESTQLNPYTADADLKNAANADKLRTVSQIPIGNRFLHLLESLKG